MKHNVVRALVIVVGMLFASAVTVAADEEPGPAMPRSRPKLSKTQQDRANQAGAEAAARLVDINSATKAEISKLPTMNDELAGKIVAGRPYSSKGQLQSRKILTFLQYEEIKELIIAKQATTVATKPPKQSGSGKSAPAKTGSDGPTGTRL